MELPVIRKDVRCYWQSKSLSSIQVKKSINFFDLDRKRKEMAGGYLTCMAALDNASGLDVGEHLEKSSRAQAACAWYPPTDLTAFPHDSYFLSETGIRPVFCTDK